MTRDAAIRNWNDAAARTLKGENHAVDMLLAAGDALLAAALRSRPAPPDDLALRHAWEAGFRLCRSYGDNHHHFDGEQKARRWRDYIKGLAAPAPVAAPAPETPAPDAMPSPSWPDANNAVRWKPDDVVGHTTVRDADGSLRHEPLTREVAEALWKTAEEARLRRVASMPDERAAIAVLFSAWLRLKELGWKEAEYCPKDGTPFDAIEPGSTGVHRCHYEGTWPDGRWWTSDEHDMYPSRPILWRRQEAQA